MSDSVAIPLLFLAFVTALTLCVKGFAKAMGKVAGADVRECHEAAEYIISTGEAPPSWLADSERSRWWTRRGAGERIGQRMDRLIGHFERSPLVADESTREFLVSQLREAQIRWRPLR